MFNPIPKIWLCGALFSATAVGSHAAIVLYADDFNRAANPTELGNTSTGDYLWQTSVYDVTGSGSSQYGISEDGGFRIDGSSHDPGVSWVNYDLSTTLQFAASFTFSFPGSANSAASFLIFPRFDGSEIPGNPAFVLRTTGGDAPSFNVFDYQGAALDGMAQQHIATSGLVNLTESGPFPAGPLGERITYAAQVEVDGDAASLFLNGEFVGTIDLAADGEGGTANFLGLGYSPNGASNRAMQVEIDNLEVTVIPEPGTAAMLALGLLLFGRRRA